MRLTELLHEVRHDLAVAVRSFASQPLFTAAALLTLAIGVGANTAVFSVVYGVLLKPLPYPDASRLVEVFEDNSRAGGGPFFRVSLSCERPRVGTRPRVSGWIARARSGDGDHPDREREERANHEEHAGARSFGIQGPSLRSSIRSAAQSRGGRVPLHRSDHCRRQDFGAGTAVPRTIILPAALFRAESRDGVYPGKQSLIAHP